MSPVRIVLQARTSSARLPGKVLLPVGGLPLAILCAKRLSGGGRFDVVLATSTDPTDDVLASIAGDYGLNVCRGPLDNVAQRFLDATEDLDDDATIVRATADNPVPDADVVAGLLDDFDLIGGDYLGSDSYPGAAYGLGAEAFHLGAFRRSTLQGMNETVAEHVTTALRGKAAPSVPNPNLFTVAGFEKLRVTVDTLDEYLIAAKAFRTQGNAVAAGWASLVEAFGTVRNAGTAGDI